MLLLGGGKSPAFLTTELFSALTRVVPDATVKIMDGLDHFAPDEKAPALVAAHVRKFLN